MAYKTHITKEQVSAIIGTPGEKIEGLIYKLPQNRLLDMLNEKDTPFIPVCEARVYSLDTGRLLFETDFLAVNKAHVVFLSDEYQLPNEF